MNGSNGVDGNGATNGIALAVETAPARVLPFELTRDEPPVMTAAVVAPPLDVPAPAPAAAPEPVPVDAAPPAPVPEAAVPVPPVEPSADEVLFRAAREANANGDTRRAMGLYRELLSLNARHVRARNNLALLLEQENEHDDALDQLDQCLAFEPGNAQVLVNRGAVLGSLARYKEAERDLRSVLHAEPENAEAHFNLGVVISRRGLWAQAIPYLRRAIELEPARAMAYYYLGEALNKVDDLTGALQAYQRAADLRPTAKILCGLGIIFDRLNRPEEAAQMYRRSREIAGR
jgi:tetratricopeptide (TPR) repeat protein